MSTSPAFGVPDTVAVGGDWLAALYDSVAPTDKEQSSVKPAVSVMMSPWPDAEMRLLSGNPVVGSVAVVVLIALAIPSAIFGITSPALTR